MFFTFISRPTGLRIGEFTDRWSQKRGSIDFNLMNRVVLHPKTASTLVLVFPIFIFKKFIGDPSTFLDCIHITGPWHKSFVGFYAEVIQWLEVKNSEIWFLNRFEFLKLSYEGIEESVPQSTEALLDISSFITTTLYFYTVIYYPDGLRIFINK